MIFDEWFHKEYEPADLQIKQYAERKEGLHIPATVYLEDLKKAFEAGQKDREVQIEQEKNFSQCKSDHNEQLRELIKKMKCCANCKHSRIEYEHCITDKHEKWELKEND